MDNIEINTIDNNFNNMLDEAYKILDNKDSMIYNLNLPQINIEITTSRVYWKNLNEYLTILNRSFDHFMIFIKNELCDRNINWYSNNKEDGIIIHGKYLKLNNITELIKKYINLYVICQSCNSPNTELTKIISKKYNFNCINCNMTKLLLI